MFQFVLFVTLVVKLSASQGIKRECKPFKDLVFEISFGNYSQQSTRLHGDCQTMMLFENITFLNISCPKTNLKRVDASILHYMDYMVNLRYVFINECGIRELGTFPYYQFLPLMNLKIERLDLSGNRIDTIRPAVFNPLKSIQRIYLNDNRISDIRNGAFSRLLELELLDLSNNRLKSIRAVWFVSTHQLKSLHLSNNFIQEIPSNMFKFRPTLTNLHLDHNNITTIHLETFSHLKNLTYLDLSFNFITNLHSDMFSHLIKFNVLDITANSFNVLTKNFLSGLNVEVLRISRNPFKCSCYNEMLTTLANAPNILCYEAVQAPIPHCWIPSNSPNFCTEHVDNNMTEMFVGYLKRLEFYQYPSNNAFSDPYTIQKCK